MIRTALSSAKIVLDPGPDLEDITIGLLDIDAAKSILGYRPEMSLEDGIGTLIQAIREEIANGKGLGGAATRDDPASGATNRPR